MAVEVERLIISLEARMDKYDAGIRAAQTATDARLTAMERRFDRFSDNLKSSTSTAALSVNKAIASVGAALGSLELSKYADQWLSLSLAFRNTESGFGVSLRSLSEINTLARETRTDLETFAQAYMRMTTATRDFGVSGEVAARATASLAMVLKLGSASTSDQANAMSKLTEAFQKGKLEGDTLGDVMEKAGHLQGLLANKLGVTREALVKMAAQGKISTRELFGALADGYDEVKSRFTAMPTTLGESMAVLKNSVTEYVGSLNLAVRESTAFVGATNAVARNSELIGDSLLTVAAGLLAAFAGGGLAAGLAKVVGVGASLVPPLRLMAMAVGAASAAYAFLADDLKITGDGLTTVRDQIDAVVAVLGERFAPAFEAVNAMWIKFTEGIATAIDYVREGWDDISAGLKSAANLWLNTTVAAVRMIVAAFGTLPAAVADVFMRVTNGAVGAVESMVNGIVAALNMIPGVDLKPVEIGRFKNSYEGAAADLVAAMKAAGQQGGQDFVGAAGASIGGFFDEVNQRAQQIGRERRFRSTTVDRPSTPTPKYASADKPDNGPFASQVRRTEEMVRDAQLEARLIGATAEKTLEAKAAMDLLNAAKKEGIAITPELVAQVDTLAQNYAKAKSEADRLRETFEEMKSVSSDVLKGFIRDLKDGKSGAEALKGSLDKIANKLIDMAVDNLVKNALGPAMGGIFGGGGGGTGAALSLFAKGGIAAHGKPLPMFANGGVSSSAAIFGETGRPEAAVPLPDGRRIPVDLRVDNARAAGGRAGGEVVVTVSASEQLLVDVDNRAEGVVARRAPQIVGAAVRETDRALPGMMRKAQKRSL